MTESSPYPEKFIVSIVSPQYVVDLATGLNVLVGADINVTPLFEDAAGKTRTSPVALRFAQLEGEPSDPDNVQPLRAEDVAASLDGLAQKYDSEQNAAAAIFTRAVADVIRRIPDLSALGSFYDHCSDPTHASNAAIDGRDE